MAHETEGDTIDMFSYCMWKRWYVVVIWLSTDRWHCRGGINCSYQLCPAWLRVSRRWILHAFVWNLVSDNCGVLGVWECGLYPSRVPSGAQGTGKWRSVIADVVIDSRTDFRLPRKCHVDTILVSDLILAGLVLFKHANYPLVFSSSAACLSHWVKQFWLTLFLTILPGRQPWKKSKGQTFSKRFQKSWKGQIRRFRWFVPVLSHCRFWFSLLVSLILLAGIVICATNLVPLAWQVSGSGWAIILPVWCVAAYSHTHQAG